MSPAGGSLRPADSADLPALVALERAAFDQDAWSEAQLASTLQRAPTVAVVLTGGDRLLGAALGWTAGGAGELLRIAVHPAARRQGAGRRLLDAFVAACRERGAEELWLEVRADNSVALALYTAAGWQPTGRRTGYYADGTDALLLALPPPGEPRLSG